MITFREIDQIRQWCSMDEKLKAILLWLFHEYKTIQMIVTEIERIRAEQIAIYTHIINRKTGKLYRPEEVPYSVHEMKPCRGGDVVLTNRYGVPLSKSKCRVIESHINETFAYDPKRPQYRVAIYHKVKGGYHHHVQVHPSTIKRSL